MLTDPMARALEMLEKAGGECAWPTYRDTVHKRTRRAIQSRGLVTIEGLWRGFELMDDFSWRVFITPAGRQALKEWRNARGEMG